MPRETEGWEKTGECYTRDEAGALLLHVSWKRDMGDGAIKVVTDTEVVEEAPPIEPAA